MREGEGRKQYKNNLETPSFMNLRKSCSFNAQLFLSEKSLP